MSKTSVVNINQKSLNKMGYANLEEWLQNPDHIYIGRTVRFVKGAKKSKWANPFSPKKYGRDKCIQLYQEYISNNQGLLDDLTELKGKTLGCWCKPLWCHGDVLIELLENQER